MITPQVHIYQPPTEQDDHHGSISRSHTPSIKSINEPDTDAHAELLGDAHKIKHTRNFSTISTGSSIPEDEPDHALLAHDHLTRSRARLESTKSQSKTEPARVTPSRPRSDSTRYYSQSYTQPVRWSKDEAAAYEAFEKEIERQPGEEQELESGQNTGLWLLGSWRNTRKEWRHGSRARVLKHYVGAPLLVVLVLGVLAIIGVIIAWSIQWR